MILKGIVRPKMKTLS